MAAHWLFLGSSPVPVLSWQKSRRIEERAAGCHWLDGKRVSMRRRSRSLRCGVGVVVEEEN
uniref:Uncharacterized protein n=1 Tax=Arundo donax TaxID=35708 RepID=A0A0A8XTF1_ARUDO